MHAGFPILFADWVATTNKKCLGPGDHGLMEETKKSAKIQTCVLLIQFEGCFTLIPPCVKTADFEEKQI